MKTKIIATLAIVNVIGMTVPAQELPTTGTVESRIGKLNFEGGWPSHETIDKLYDAINFQRACQAYLWGLPLVSVGEWR
jgi:hypothetical protein